MEIKFSSLDKDLQQGIKEFLGNDENSPNWEFEDEIFLILSGGSTNYNLCINQNSMGWMIVELPIKLQQYR